MPKLVYSCGNFLSYGAIPNEGEYLFISDTDYDKYPGSVDSEQLYEEMRRFFQSPFCGTLWVFWEGREQPPTEYNLQPRKDVTL